jgi:hypothetical protein
LLSAPSWSGPDDGIVFDSLNLKALNGAFSLEGGAETYGGASIPAAFPARASFFEVADGILPCGDSTVSLPANLNQPAVTVRRLENADPLSVCQPIPYTLTQGPQSVTFLKPLAQQTTAQFVLDLTWTQPINPLGTASNTATRMNYQSFTGSPDIPLNWCPNPQFTGATLTGIVDPLLQADQDPSPPGLNGIQFACVGTSFTSVVNPTPAPGDEYLQIVEQIYLEGDAYASRGG